MEKNLNQHYYFCTIWQYLSCQKQNKFQKLYLQVKESDPMKSLSIWTRY